MSGKRLFAIVVIFVLAAGAWLVLAGSVEIRSTSSDERLGDAVGGLWGSEQRQSAPTFTYGPGGTASRIDVAASDITAGFKLNQRRKGLLWYATYVVDFKAAYKVKNPTTQTVDTTMAFDFPDAQGTYDGFAVKVDGAEVPVVYREGKAYATFTMLPGTTASVATGYRTNGMDRWVYVPSPGGAGVVRDFNLAMATDFTTIDYPSDGVSPTSSSKTGDGWNLVWKYSSVVSGRPIGIVMPVPPNPGPLVARITAFAPVSLLFFFAALDPPDRDQRSQAAPGPLRLPRRRVLRFRPAAGLPGRPGRHQRRVRDRGGHVGGAGGGLPVGRGREEPRAPRDRGVPAACSSCCSATASSSAGSPGSPSPSGSC